MEEVMRDLKHIWLKNKINITKYEYIFFPIHLNFHWNLIIVENYNNFFSEILKAI